MRLCVCVCVYGVMCAVQEMLQMYEMWLAMTNQSQQPVDPPVHQHNDNRHIPMPTDYAEPMVRNGQTFFKYFWALAFIRIGMCRERKLVMGHGWEMTQARFEPWSPWMHAY